MQGHVSGHGAQPHRPRATSATGKLRSPMAQLPPRRSSATRITGRCSARAGRSRAPAVRADRPPVSAAIGAAHSARRRDAPVSGSAGAATGAAPWRRSLLHARMRARQPSPRAATKRTCGPGVSARPIERWSPATTRRAWASSSSHARAFTTPPRSPLDSGWIRAHRCPLLQTLANRCYDQPRPGTRTLFGSAPCRRPRPWGQKNAHGLHNRRCCLRQTPAQTRKQRNQGAPADGSSGSPSGPAAGRPAGVRLTRRGRAPHCRAGFGRGAVSRAAGLPSGTSHRRRAGQGRLQRRRCARSSRWSRCRVSARLIQRIERHGAGRPRRRVAHRASHRPRCDELAQLQRRDFVPVRQGARLRALDVRHGKGDGRRRVKLSTAGAAIVRWDRERVTADDVVADARARGRAQPAGDPTVAGDAGAHRHNVTAPPGNGAAQRTVPRLPLERGRSPVLTTCRRG